MRGPACIVWGDLTPCSLPARLRRHRAGGRPLPLHQRVRARQPPDAQPMAARPGPPARHHAAVGRWHASPLAKWALRRSSGHARGSVPSPVLSAPRPARQGGVGRESPVPTRSKCRHSATRWCQRRERLRVARSHHRARQLFLAAGRRVGPPWRVDSRAAELLSQRPGRGRSTMS